MAPELIAKIVSLPLAKVVKEIEAYKNNGRKPIKAAEEIYQKG